jgi:endonuclease G, mitochondrial
VDEKDGELRAMAFIIGQNVKATDRPEKFLVSIDEIERRTGLDFLSELPDDLEERLEAQVAARMW